MALGDSSYRALSRGLPGIETSVASALLRTIAELASILCVGALAVSAFVVPRTGRDRLEVTSGIEFSIARWSSIVWAAAAFLLIGVDAADSNGVSLARLLEPGALGFLAQASYLPGAWIVVSALTLTIFCAAVFVRTWMASVMLLGLAIVALLAPVLVTQVLVGPNHDYGGDAAIFGNPAFAIWAGATVVVAVGWRAAIQTALAIRRFVTLSAICGFVAAASQLVISMFELAGGSPLDTPTGLLFLVQFGIFLALGIMGVVVVRSGAAASTGSRLPPSLIGAILLMSAYIGIAVVMTRIPPPQYFVPTSITQLFLGFDIVPTPTLDVLASEWRLNILFAVISALAVALYSIGVWRLRSRGDTWFGGRTFCWVAGWTVIFITTSSGLGKYSSASFSLHMVLHMSLNMLGPLLLVMGGAVTLALRAIPARSRDHAAGPHEWLTGVLNWSVTRSAFNPLWVFATFVGSYYVIYLTPLFQEAMRYHWSHQAMNLHFLVGGYLFYSLVIGVDHPPRPLPHIGKLGMVLAAMPFHAFFGVIIMSSTTIIAQTYYDYLDQPWMTDLAGDQYLGGGIAWSAGELPLIVVVIALAIQWSKQDARAAARKDRHLDSGIDDSLDVYNDMLARLSSRQPASLQPSSKEKLP